MWSPKFASSNLERLQIRMKKLLPFAILGLLFTASCKKDNTDTTPSNQIPSSYNFSNVNFQGQTDRLNMLAEITAVMKKPASGEVIPSGVLANMFANTNSPFASAELNNSTKDLKSKCFAGVANIPGQADFEYLMNMQTSLSSSSTGPWAPGSAGVATSGSKQYYFDQNGLEYAQIVEKGLMGAVFYYQICETYTREAKIGDGVDNTTVTEGKGTDMEHHWDEAFGYFGAPTTLTEQNYEELKKVNELRFHAKYAAVGSDAGLKTVGNVMSQYILGRHAISNKNYGLRDTSAELLRKEYELILVTSAIHYLNGAASNFADDAIRNHELSEAYAFIISLYYNSDKTISSADLENVLHNFTVDQNGTPVPSFLQVTLAKIANAKNLLSAAYNLDSVKDTL